MAQGCHAATAVTHMFYNDPNTVAYLSDLDNMHKVVLEVLIKLLYFEVIISKIVEHYRLLMSHL